MTWLPLLVILALSFGCSFLDGVEKNPPLLVIVLDSDGDREMSSTTEALELLASSINNSSSILPGHHLQLLRRDGWCGYPPEPGLGPYPTAEVLLGARGKEQPVTAMGIIGPTCSSSALFLGSLLRRDDTAPIQIHLAQSHLLEDREGYSKSFGIAGSSSLLLRASVELIKMNGWTEVSVMYDESHLYHPFSFHSIDQGLQNSNFAVNEYFVSGIHTYIPLDQVKRESRIVFLFLHRLLVRKVLCLAFRQRVTFPVYQFVIAGVNFAEVVNNSAVFPQKFICSGAELAVACSGAVFVDFAEEYQHRANFSLADDLILQEMLLNIQVDIQTSHYLDALLSLVLAVSRQVDINGSACCGDSNGAIFDNLFAQQFAGFSGQVVFNESTGFVDREVLVRQFLEDKLNLLFTYSARGRLTTAGKGLFLPSEIQVVDVVIPYSPAVSRPLAYVTFISTAAVIIFLATLHILTVLHRNSKQVKASSWKIMQLAFLGSYLLAGSTVAHAISVGFYPTDVKVRCYLFHVIYGSLMIGYTLIEGTMCVLTWRLYRIFVAYKNPGRCLSNRALVAVLFLFVCVSAAISTAWYVADPLLPLSDPESVTETFSIYRGLDANSTSVQVTKSQFWHCSSSSLSSLLWFAMLLMINITLVVTTCVFAFLIRKVPMKQFRTVQLIRLNYMVKFIGLFTVFMYMALTLNSSSTAVLIRFIIYSILINTMNVLICVFLYLPPLWTFSLKGCF